jgi:hypothetical protein
MWLAREICSLQAPGARRPGGSSICKVVQQLQHDGAEALKAKVCVNNWAGRRELDCEVVKETKTRYVCRLLSDGLLPRVRCLRSLISANTPRQCPLPIFPFLAC